MLTTDVTTTLGNVSIGLSKQLKDLLTSDLTDDIVNVGGTDKRVRIASVWGDGFPDIPTSTSGAMSSTRENDYASIYLNPSDNQNYSCGVSNAYSNGMYVRSVLVYIPSTEYLGGDEDYLYSGNQGDVRIVTSVNIQDVHMYAYAWRENTTQMEADDTNNTYIYNLRPKLRDNETNSTVTARGGCIYPAWLIVIGDKVAIWTGVLCRAYDNYGNRGQWGNGNYNFYSFNGFNRMTITSRMFDEENTQIYPGGSGRAIEYVYSDIEDYKIKWGFYEYYPYYWTAPVDRVTKAMYMDYVSRAGLYFVVGSGANAKRYKPIISNGIVTGYTDDLSAKSDIDDWTNVNDHNISPTPPGPEPSDDYPDDPWGKIEWGGAYLGAGNFTNLWYCTATDLDNLRRWMNGVDAAHPLPEGFNPMNQILGLMQFPIGLGGTLTEELTMRTQANVTVHSGVMINKGFGDDLYYNLGSIDIPLRMKERGVPFLDYGSTIELYVPFCGVFQLDPQTVLGADLAVEMWLSPVTGECNCIVSVGRGNNRGPVAFGSGNMASDIPVTANGYGLYAAAAKEASLKRSELMLGGVTQGTQSLSFAANTANTLAIGEQIAGESIAGAWGAAGATVGGVSAAIGLGVALAQATHNIHALDVGMQHAKNASGTSVSGSFSGTSAWHYPFQCYVKITRPRYRIPSNYAHTQGIPLIKAKTLSSCNGFTMCVGTDLSSVSATEIEKEQIAAFLSNGVIV